MKINEAREKSGPRFLVKGRSGGKNRYSFDGKILELEDVLPGSFTYPEDYGIVLNTHCDEGGPLDGFLITEESCPPGCIVEFRPIGTVKIEGSTGSDEKIICVASKDNGLDDINDVKDLHEERVEGIREFLETCGYLNDEDIKVEGRGSKERGKKLLKHTRKLYKRKNK